MWHDEVFRSLSTLPQADISGAGTTPRLIKCGHSAFMSPARIARTLGVGSSPEMDDSGRSYFVTRQFLLGFAF
jgi:hypothetical protein